MALPGNQSSYTTSDLDKITDFLRVAHNEDGSLAGSVVEAALGGSLTAAIASRNRWKPEASGATIVTGFASGHGWLVGTTSTGGAINLNDTATPGPLSAQAVSMVVGSGSASTVQKAGLGLDLTGKSLLIWIKYEGAITATLPEFTVYAGDSGLTNFYSTNAAQPPYGAVDIHASESGWICIEWIPGQAVYGAGSTGVTTGAPTIAAIDTIRLRVNGNATTPAAVVRWGGIGYRTLGAVYPNGVVSFTFDDTDSNEFTLARPTLAKYNLPATSFVIVDKVGTTGPSAAQYRQMQNELGWEIAGHAYTSANHDTRFENLSASDLLSELKNLRTWLLDNGFSSESWASPGGAAGQAVWDVAQEFFNSHRSAGYGGNRLLPVQTAPSVAPYLLIAGSWDATAGSTVAGFKAAIDNAYTNKSWLIFNFHQVTTAASTAENISTADLDSIAAYCVSKGIAVKTIQQVWRESGIG